MNLFILFMGTFQELFVFFICRRWYEELKQQYKAEKEKFVATIDQHLKTIEDLTSEIRELKKSKEVLSTEMSSQEKQIK